MVKISGDFKEEITRVIESNSDHKEKLKHYKLRFNKLGKSVSVMFFRDNWTRFYFTVKGDSFRFTGALMGNDDDYLLGADIIKTKDKIKEKVLEYYG